MSVSQGSVRPCPPRDARGVNSPVRARSTPWAAPRSFIAAAKGPHLTDVDGREYVDLVCLRGPALIGHAHPVVTEAVHEAVGARPGLRRHHAWRDRAPRSSWWSAWHPLEEIRMVSTGTEATDDLPAPGPRLHGP
ncbi:aminotransferase class III-fold pyridoxal phosphate-dependent enzyme [Kocuria rhizophila]|nr:aminotransferase class III-fold pyridoxal phosphate-dependent enzyme [Kocuria rhizophila]